MRKVVITLCTATSLQLISITTHANIPLGGIGVSASIGFINSDSGDGSCPSGVTITEQAPLDFGSFASSSDGIMIVDPGGDGINFTVNGSPESTGGASRGSFLVKQDSPQDACNVVVTSPSEDDPSICNPLQTMNGATNGQSIPFRVAAAPGPNGTFVNPESGSIWYTGGAIQTSCSVNRGKFAADSYTGSYNVDVDNM